MILLKLILSILLSFILACTGTSLNDDENEIEKEVQVERPDDLPGFYVDGRHIYDRCGEEVIIRGVNRMTIVLDFEQNESGQTVYNPLALNEIAKTGANSVRIMWMMWRDAHLVEEAVAHAIELDMIPILELHDATGQWDRLDEVVDYWLDELLEIVMAYEENLIVNIANEAGTHDVTDQQYLDGYTRAIDRMREAGIRTPLVIDAAGWGRAVEQLLRMAPDLIEADPHRNLIFSWHPWDTGDGEAERVTNAMEKSVDEEIPFVIGEFSHTSVGCRGEVPYHHIMAEAERLGIGWLAWSWGPGNGDCETMDMTNDATFETLFDWGLETAVTDPNSIKNTSIKPASMTAGTACPQN